MVMYHFYYQYLVVVPLIPSLPSPEQVCYFRQLDYGWIYEWPLILRSNTDVPINGVKTKIIALLAAQVCNVNHAL